MRTLDKIVGCAENKLFDGLMSTACPVGLKKRVARDVDDKIINDNDDGTACFTFTKGAAGWNGAVVGAALGGEQSAQELEGVPVAGRGEDLGHLQQRVRRDLLSRVAQDVGEDSQLVVGYVDALKYPNHLALVCDGNDHAL